MKRTGLLVLVIVCVLVLAVVLFFALNPRGQRAMKQQGFLFSRAMLQSRNSQQPPIAVPLYWDHVEGGFMIDVRLGDNWVPLVFDSGSCHISAKGLQCTWKQCDTPNRCTVNSCCQGEDCIHKAYIPRSPRDAPLLQQRQQRQQRQQLQYGSQTSDVTHHLETFSLLKLMPTCSDLQKVQTFKSTKDALRQIGIPQNMQPNTMDLVQYGPSVIHHIYEITGDTASNIFGVAQGGGATESVINALFPEQNQDMIWSMYVRQSCGFFCLGPIPCFAKPTRYVKLESPSAFRSFVTQFYVVRLRSVSVSGRPLPKSATPRYVVLDSGTTESYGSVQFQQALRGAGYQPGESDLQLELDGGVQLKYAPDQLHGAFESTLDNFDSLFNNVHVILLGIELMRNIYFEYNLTSQMLGIVQE